VHQGNKTGGNTLLGIRYKWIVKTRIDLGYRISLPSIEDINRIKMDILLFQSSTGRLNKDKYIDSLADVDYLGHDIAMAPRSVADAWATVAGRYETCLPRAGKAPIVNGRPLCNCFMCDECQEQIGLYEGLAAVGKQNMPVSGQLLSSDSPLFMFDIIRCDKNEFKCTKPFYHSLGGLIGKTPWLSNSTHCHTQTFHAVPYLKRYSTAERCAGAQVRACGASNVAASAQAPAGLV
jgi:hypothetical protein